MGAAVWGFLGALAGGVLTVVAQTVSGMLGSRSAARRLSEEREQHARAFQRGTLIELEAALVEYRTALSRDRRTLLPSRDSDAVLSAARSRFRLLVYRVQSVRVRDAVLAWEDAALAWFGGDDTGTAAAEAGAWDTAVLVTGEAIRAAE
jgi:hypothetical protein